MTAESYAVLKIEQVEQIADYLEQRCKILMDRLHHTDVFSNRWEELWGGHVELRRALDLIKYGDPNVGFSDDDDARSNGD